MRHRVFDRYDEYSERPHYQNPTEDIIHRDMLLMEKRTSDSRTDLVYSFDEFANNGEAKTIGVSYMNTDELTAPHHHDCYEFNIVLNGTVVEHIGKEFFTLHGGDVLIMHPHVTHSLYTYQKCRAINVLIYPDYFEKIRIMLEAALPCTFLDDIIENRSFRIFQTKGDAFAKTLCENMFSWWRTKASLHDRTRATLEADCIAFLTLLSQKHSDTDYTKRHLASESKDKRQQIVRYIRDNYASVTVEETAAVFGYSPSQICRIVKKETGNTFQGIIMAKRLLLSLHLLVDTNYPISQIAEIVGVSGSAYFSYFFHGQVGCTPLEYRKKMRDGTFRDEEAPQSDK